MKRISLLLIAALLATGMLSGCYWDHDRRGGDRDRDHTYDRDHDRDYDRDYDRDRH